MADAIACDRPRVDDHTPAPIDLARRTDEPRLTLAVTIDIDPAGTRYSINASASIRPDWSPDGAEPVEDLSDLIDDLLREDNGRLRERVARTAQPQAPHPQP